MLINFNIINIINIINIVVTHIHPWQFSFKKYLLFIRIIIKKQTL